MNTSTNILLTFTSAIFLTSSAVTASIILEEDFEDNTLSFTTSIAMFHDGTGDYFTITPLNGNARSETGSFTGFGGSHFFAAEDIDDGGTRPGTNTLIFDIDIGGYENITLSTLFAAGGNDANPGYDSNDGFLMRAKIGDGSFQNLLAFEAVGTTNQPLSQDTDFNGTGDGPAIDHNFLLYDGLAVTGTGTTLTLEIIVTSNDGNGQFAFDNVKVEGDLVPEPSSALLALTGCALFLSRRRR